LPGRAAAAADMSRYRGEGPPLARIEDWYATPLGAEVAGAEVAAVERQLAGVIGYYLLQIGVAGVFCGGVGEGRIRRRIQLPAAPRPSVPGLQVAAEPALLPIASDSVDAVLLPHTLDLVTDPQAALREAERVLIPEGRVVVVGFNALSLWGAWGLMGQRRGRVPWCGRFLTPFRVRDWLTLLGFDVEAQEMLVFRPPWPRAALRRGAPAMDALGARFWPLLGGVYVVRGVKRVSTLTPLRPSWAQRRALLAGGAVEPTTREGGHA
jgi:SAM-dependent methyltransferase